MDIDDALFRSEIRTAILRICHSIHADTLYSKEDALRELLRLLKEYDV